jgi:hypothetical protein
MGKERGKGSSETPENGETPREETHTIEVSLDNATLRQQIKETFRPVTMSSRFEDFIGWTRERAEPPRPVPDWHLQALLPAVRAMYPDKPVGGNGMVWVEGVRWDECVILAGVVVPVESSHPCGAIHVGEMSPFYVRLDREAATITRPIVGGK